MLKAETYLRPGGLRYSSRFALDSYRGCSGQAEVTM